MTPQERLAELRSLWEGGCTYAWFAAIDRSATEILALVEAVPERLASGHSDWCKALSCRCGHNKLKAAWVALGDDATVPVIRAEAKEADHG